jgi:hypothetical protein
MARKPQIWMRFIAALILAALALWGGGLGAHFLIAIIALIVFALVAFDISTRRQNLLVS